VAPGIPGGAAALLLPLLFFLPLEAVPVFGERFRGVAILVWLSSFALALSIRGAEPVRRDTAIWAYQKGFSLGEMGLEDWLLDLGLLGLSSLWWALAGAVSLSAPGPSSAGLWLPLFSIGFTTAALTHTLTFSLSAFGVRRPSDPTVLLAILSLLAPVLSFRAPEWVGGLTETVLPPFRAAVELHGALRGKEVEGIIHSLFHLLVFSGMVLWMGLARLSAWRPTG